MQTKLYLEYHSFGRYWKNGVYYGGYGVSLNRIKTLMSKYSTIYKYDEKNESPYAIMTIKSQEIKPMINGKTLNTGTYVFWYENEKSISSKLELIDKYNLKGAGSWSLGQETPETWGYYNAKLNQNSNDNYIEPENPREESSTPSAWATEAIEYVQNQKWMQGRGNGNFSPRDELTRAEFATVITRILNLEEYSVDKRKYVDTNGHWAEKYINLATVAGYMQGYGDGTFKPNEKISREEIAKVLSLMKLKTETEIERKPNFIDVKTTSWSYDSIIKIAKYGVMNGYEDATFRPKNKISREEMAVTLMRAF